MANITITRNKTLPNSSDKSDFHDLVDTATATITNIEQTDLASGIGTVIRQATTPSDTDQIWVDTSVTPYVVRIYDGTEWIATGAYAVLTNKSGAQRTLGDVCVIDTTNDGAFTTTTLYGDPRETVVVMETIDDSSDGVVALAGGRVTNLKVDSAVARGDWLATASTAGRAAKTFMNGFAVALASIGGSGTISEALLNRNSVSLLANASIPVAGISGQFLKTLGAGANSLWASPIHGLSEMLKLTGTNFTTSSTSFVDITGLTITRTIVSTKVLMFYNGPCSLSSSAGFLIDLVAGGTSITGSTGYFYNQNNDAGVEKLISCIGLATGLTPGSNVFKVQAKTNGTGTFTAYLDTVFAQYLTILEI